MFRKYCALLVALGLVVFGIFHCSKKSTNPSPISSSITITDNLGNGSPFACGTSPHIEFKGLKPNHLYEIEVSCNQTPFNRHYRLSTNSAGNMPRTTLDFELNQDDTDTIGIYEYTVTVKDAENSQIVKQDGFIIDKSKPRVFTCDASGNPKNSFTPGETVYLRGIKLTPGTRGDIYVCHDRKIWTPVNKYIDVSGGTETVTVNQRGEFLIPIWHISGALSMPFDVIFDTDRDGIFSDGDLSDGWSVASFVVQRPTKSDLIEQIACDINGFPRDHFYITQSEDNIYVCCNPRVQLNLPSTSVTFYVVQHRGSWRTGDTLIDKSSGVEQVWTQSGCSSVGVTLVASNLPSGYYDAIIDVNENGRYDVGVDFIDNINDVDSSYGLEVVSDSLPFRTRPSLTGKWMVMGPEAGVVELHDNGSVVTGHGDSLLDLNQIQIFHEYRLSWTSIDTVLTGYLVWHNSQNGCTFVRSIAMRVTKATGSSTYNWIDAGVAYWDYNPETCEITSDTTFQYYAYLKLPDTTKTIIESMSDENNLFVPQGAKLLLSPRR